MMSRTIRHSRFASSGRIDRSAIYGFFRLMQTPGEQLLGRKTWKGTEEERPGVRVGNCGTLRSFVSAVTGSANCQRCSNREKPRETWRPCLTIQSLM